MIDENQDKVVREIKISEITNNVLEFAAERYNPPFETSFKQHTTNLIVSGCCLFYENFRNHKKERILSPLSLLRNKTCHVFFI